MFIIWRYNSSVSLVFKTRYTNFSGSGWQKEKQEHWTGNFDYLYFDYKKPPKIKKFIELIRYKRIKRICRCVSNVGVCIYNYCNCEVVLLLQD